MNIFQTAQLDNVCPYEIESKELLNWTGLNKLEQDFALFRSRTNQLDTRIKTRTIKKLTEKSLELTDIFVIPSNDGLTAQDIIDIRLCAYIRMLEFILREIGSTSGQKIEVWLISLTDNSPSIIESFSEADGTPDVRWFFKNRIMTFLLRKSWLNHTIYHKYPDYSLIYPDHSLLPFLENRSLYIDEDDCYVIMRDVVFPDFVPAMKKYYKCDDCHDENPKRYWLSEKRCTHLVIMQSLVDRHESILQKSIEFSMEQLYQVYQRNQAKLLLCILFRVAHDRNEWRSINATLALLFASSAIEMKAFAIRLFGKLVGWNKSQDGASFEMLSEHFDIMIELLESPSNEIQDANHYAWRFLGGSNRLKPASYQLLRLVISSYFRRIDRVPHSKLSKRKLEGVGEKFETLCRLIMPKVNDNTGKFDFTSDSNQLFGDLKMIEQMEAIPGSLFGKFESICGEYRDSLMDDNLKNQFVLICDKAIWLIVKQLNSNGSSRSLQDGELLVDSYMTSMIYGARRWRWPGCFSLASNSNYCEILLEIHQHFYDPKQILEPQRCSWFIQVVLGLGSLRYNEEKLKALESCLLRAIELHPNRRSQFKTDTSKLRESTIPVSLLCSKFRLYYHVRRTKKFMSPSMVSRISRYDIQGIQSRRMLLVSLCKYLIAGSNCIFISRMIDLLGELESAYKLRAEQKYSEIDSPLVPSCAELAFPTPFDDPNNPLYICEFAYFRDTMDHLRRNKQIEFDRVCSQLSYNKKKRLKYYQDDYHDFDVCCLTKRLDKERDKFRCIEHKIDDQEKILICPLLNRYQYCEYIKY